MSDFELEGDWLVLLEARRKSLFLTSLAHTLTIIARDTYEAQTEEVEKPRQLRCINEVQHRLLACLRGVLAGTNVPECERSIARWVLDHSDIELQLHMEWAWFSTKEILSQCP
jgi:hypothetical protein